MPSVSSWTNPPPDAAVADDAPVPAPAHGHHLPAGAHVADRRGLTATGAVTVAVALGLLGAVIDVSTGRGLRTLFAICFVLGSALATLLVHREDLKAAVVMPPLTYCAVAFLGGVLSNATADGSFLKQQGLELLTSLVIGAPVLFAATGAALVIALVRGMTGRRA